MFDFDADINRRTVPALKTHPMVLGEDGAHLFAAGVADMDFQVAPAVIAAIQDRAAHGVFGYEAVPSGLVPALTGWLRQRHGWTVDPDHVLRAPNALNSLAIAASLFSDEGDGIIVQPPVFFDFFDIIRENKRSLVINPLLFDGERYTMDFDGLARLVADPKNKILYLCNPHNPVGRVWTASELTELGRLCADNDVLVVSDELHGDLVFDGHRYTPFALLDERFAQNSITLLSPAKSFNIAGCCWSFTIVPDGERRAAFKAENSRLTVNKNNAFASVAMLAAYRDGGPWLDAAIEYLAGNLDLVRQRIGAMDGVRLIEPEGTFLVWLDCRGLGKSHQALTRFLREQAGWAVTRGIAFGEQGDGFARLNIACPRARLAAAFDQLEAALGGGR